MATGVLPDEEEDGIMRCDYDGCEQPVILRAYAAYNADSGEHVHPRHARYPAPMIRACADHVGRLMVRDADSPGSTRQWLTVSLTH
jgi:hypothetical protein